MIYAQSTDKSTIFVGLSERNLELLRQGKPIIKDLPGMPRLVVLYGATEEKIIDQLRPLLHPDLHVRAMPEVKKGEQQ